MLNMTTETGTRASVHIQPIEVEKVIFTSTPYASPQQRYQNMTQNYENLLNKEHLKKEDVEEFRSLVNVLTTEPDWYEEGLFKLRKLNNRYVKQNKKNVTKDQRETLEDYLINKKLMDFINIGSLGRSWVVARLVEEEIRGSSDEEVEKQVDEKITLLDEQLSLLKGHEKEEDFMKRLSALDITFDYDLSAGRVAEQLLLRDLTKVNTLSDLHRLVASVKNDIEEVGYVDSTFEERTFEQFHHQTSSHEK